MWYKKRRRKPSQPQIPVIYSPASFQLVISSINEKLVIYSINEKLVISSINEKLKRKNNSPFFGNKFRHLLARGPLCCLGSIQAVSSPPVSSAFIITSWERSKDHKKHWKRTSVAAGSYRDNIALDRDTNVVSFKDQS